MIGRQAKAAVLAMAAKRIADKNAVLVGRQIIYRRDLRPGHVMVYDTGYEVSVEQIQPARARNYLVIDGTDDRGQAFRTSGHVLDEVTIKR